MKNVCVVTSTRADYGIMRPLIFAFLKDEDFNLRLVVTGSHLSKRYGMTVDEIKADEVPIDEQIQILTGEDTAEAASIAMANALIGFSTYFDRHRPDMLLVLGDRYEMAAVCCAAVNARIPIAHIHGGETTEGAIDECYRHSITKMSYLHFAACEAYRRRIIQLGEAPERVFNVGAMGVENAVKIPKLTQQELTEQIGFDFEQPYAVVTFHPVTLENNTVTEQCEALFAALDCYPQLGLLITKSNADAGGQAVNDAMDAYAAKRKNCLTVFSLGARRYLSALKYAKFVIGNSSSGIAEVPSFGIPTVNIGDRQRGRLQATSVLNCAAVQQDIAMAIEMALSDDFRSMAQTTVNPYGSGDTAQRILDTVKDYLFNDKIDLKKKFYDIHFEVTP